MRPVKTKNPTTTTKPKNPGPPAPSKISTNGGKFALRFPEPFLAPAHGYAFACLPNRADP